MVVVSLGSGVDGNLAHIELGHKGAHVDDATSVLLSAEKIRHNTASEIGHRIKVGVYLLLNLILAELIEPLCFIIYLLICM